MRNPRILLIFVACAAAVLLRIIDNPIANLSAMGALALLCGAMLRHPAALLIPLGVRALTDVIIHLRTGYGFFESWWFDYSAYALIFALGLLVRRRNYGSVVAGGLAAALVYFLVSNFGVWLAWPETYPTTFPGLMSCYENAIPFARGTFAGDVVFSLVFFGAWNALAIPVGEERPVHNSGTA